MTRVLLADTDLAVRSAIALMLRHKLGVTDICETSEADQLCTCLAQFHPNVVLVDWALPGLDVATICAKIRCGSGHPVIIVMSIQSENEAAALASGAHAFLHKRASGEHVLNLLRAYLIEN